MFGSPLPRIYGPNLGRNGKFQRNTRLLHLGQVWLQQLAHNHFRGSTSGFLAAFSYIVFFLFCYNHKESEVWNKGIHSPRWTDLLNYWAPSTRRSWLRRVSCSPSHIYRLVAELRCQNLCATQATQAFYGHFILSNTIDTAL